MSTFFVIDFFDKINSFDTFSLHQFSKFNNFPWVCWFCIPLLKTKQSVLRHQSGPMMALAHASKVLWKVVCTLYGFEENDFLLFIFFTYYKSRNLSYLLRQIKVDGGSFPLFKDIYLHVQCKKMKIVMENGT